MKLFHGTTAFAALRIVQQGFVVGSKKNVYVDDPGPFTGRGYTYWSTTTNYAVGVASVQSTIIEQENFHGPLPYSLRKRGFSGAAIRFLCSPAIIVSDVPVENIFPDPESLDPEVLYRVYVKHPELHSMIQKKMNSVSFNPLSSRKSLTKGEFLTLMDHYKNFFAVFNILVKKSAPKEIRGMLPADGAVMTKGRIPVLEAYCFGTLEKPDYDTVENVKGYDSLRSLGHRLDKTKVSEMIKKMKARIEK